MTPSDPDWHWRTMRILCGGLVFFTVITIIAAHFFPQNAAMYALFSGILGNFSGALFTKIKS